MNGQPPTAPTLPERAQVVVIGGGVIGCSIAYHLAALGCPDVVVLERDRLTSGTTWHAAGLVTTFGSTSPTATRMRLYGRDLYARLEAETGQATGFRAVGLIEAAADADRLHEYRRVAAFQRTQGLEVHEISPAEIADRFPLARTQDLLAGFYVPGDGRVNPVDLTRSLARGATLAGARIVEGAHVDAVVTDRDRLPRVTGVRFTRAGVGHELECQTVVNAAGMWARELAAANGVIVPNQAAEHYYLITEPIDGVHPDLPVFEDPAAYGYYREEGGGLMVGLFEPVAAPWRVQGIPRDFSFADLEPDWDRLEPFLRTAMTRVPVTLDAGIRMLFCGPESFTPDLAPAVGPAPGIDGYFVCAGLNSVGVLSSGGLGRILAQWIVAGSPDVDVRAWSPDRFAPYQLTPRFRAARTREVLGTVYAAHTPGRQLASARGVRRMPLHDKHAAEGACFAEVAGWEVPAWYAGPGPAPAPVPSWHAAPGEPWWQAWRSEHEAGRAGVGLTDLSHTAKLLLHGPGAAALAARLVAADLADGVSEHPVRPGGAVPAGAGPVAPGQDTRLVLAPASAHGRLTAWLARACDTDRQQQVQDVTTAFALLAVHGPRSAELLTSVSESAFAATDLDAPAVPATWVDLGCAPALAVATGQTGQPGWLLLVPVEHAGHGYETLVDAGRDLGLRQVGSRAWQSLCLEHGAATGTPVPHEDRALVHLRLLDPAPLLHHAEVVLRDGAVVGHVLEGSYGFTLGAAVGLAAVTVPTEETEAAVAWLARGRWEVDIAGDRHLAEVSLGRPDRGSSGENQGRP